MGAVKKNVISKEDNVTLTKLLKIGRRKRNLRDENVELSSSDDESPEDEDRIESRTSLHSKKKHTKRMVGNSNINIKNHKNAKAPRNDKNKITNENQTKKLDIESKDSCNPKLNSVERNSQVGSKTVKRTDNKKRKRKKTKQRNVCKDISVNKADS